MNHPPADDVDLTWAALLGAWTDFAKAAVALPDDAEGSGWKASVPAIIDLQATVRALGDLERLPVGHWAAAVDTAEVIITRRIRELNRVWPDGAPDGVVEVILDAYSAAKAARELI